MEEHDSYFELRHDRTLKVLFLLLFGAVIAGLALIFRYYFWPFLFAVILYMAVKPIHDFLLMYLKNRGLVSAVMILSMIILVLVPLFFVITAIIEQAYQLYMIVQREIQAGAIRDIYALSAVENLMAYLSIDPGDVASKIADMAERASGMFLSSAQAVIAYPLKLLVNFFFFILMLFFLFKDGGRLGSLVYRVLPFPEELESKVVNRMNEVIRVLITGNMLIMLLQGLMVGIGFRILGVPLAFLGGSVSAILSLIPVVGTCLVWGPMVIYLLIIGSYLKALILGAWCVFWYLVLENLVKPKAFGRRLNFHPVVFFFLLLGSIQAFGLPGVLLGPLLLTLFYSLWEIYKMLQERDVNLPDEESAPSVP
jgi:predicted PurR-regulated permease PerM